MVMDGRKDRWTDRQMAGQPADRTDGRTDGQNGQMEKLRNGTTDKAGYKIACTRLKMRFNPEKISKVHRLTYIWVKQKKRKMICELPNVVVTF